MEGRRKAGQKPIYLEPESENPYLSRSFSAQTMHLQDSDSSHTQLCDSSNQHNYYFSVDNYATNELLATAGKLIFVSRTDTLTILNTGNYLNSQ
jgi:hypothetical protein